MKFTRYYIVNILKSAQFASYFKIGLFAASHILERKLTGIFIIIIQEIKALFPQRCLSKEIHDRMLVKEKLVATSVF